MLSAGSLKNPFQQPVRVRVHQPPLCSRGQREVDPHAVAPGAADSHPDARRRRRSFGWCPTIRSACGSCTTTASRASTARGVPSLRRSPTSSSRAGSSSPASRASAATPARTSTCSRSRASAATSARAATPSASPPGRSGWTRRSSRPSRTGRSCSRFRSGCAPDEVLVDADRVPPQGDLRLDPRPMRRAGRAGARGRGADRRRRERRRLLGDE